ncbi:putative NodU family carbamoyl transferase [Bradyrhizobium ottawaense]
MSAFAMSGFEQSLVFAIDGGGDFLSGLMAVGSGTVIAQLVSFPEHNSLGLFYLETIRYLGCGMFDEYKVMGLAPYGDPDRYRELFAQFYELLDSGGYRVHLDRIGPALLRNIPGSAKGNAIHPTASRCQRVAAGSAGADRVSHPAAPS